VNDRGFAPANLNVVAASVIAATITTPSAPPQLLKKSVVRQRALEIKNVAATVGL